MPSSTLRAEIPLTDLRAAFGRSSMSLSAVARAAGYDQAYVARMLADRVTYYYRTLSNGERRRYRIQRHSVTYETAVRLARAMGLDPVDVGL
jgi:hypothetical protein